MIEDFLSDGNMEFINEYLEEIIKVKPLGTTTTVFADEPDKAEVIIDGDNTGIYVSWIEYAKWLEKKYKKLQLDTVVVAIADVDTFGV